MEVTREQSIERLEQWVEGLERIEGNDNFNLYKWSSILRTNGQNLYLSIKARDINSFIEENGIDFEIPEEWKEQGRIVPQNYRLLISCGYAGCAAGYLPTIFKKEWAFNRTMDPTLVHEYNDFTGYKSNTSILYDLQNFFGISRDQVKFIVMPKFYRKYFHLSDQIGTNSSGEPVFDITKEMAIDHINLVRKEVMGSLNIDYEGYQYLKDEVRTTTLEF